MSKFILLLALVAFVAAAPAPLPEAAAEASPAPAPEPAAEPAAEASPVPEPEAKPDPAPVPAPAPKPAPAPAPKPAPAPAPKAAPEEDEKKAEVIPILKSESDQHEDGSYSFLFESGDGNFRQEKAIITNPGTDEESIQITGSYKYTDANGEEVLVTYTADENGFVPVGSVIAKEISDAALAARDLPKVEVEKVEKVTKVEKKTSEE